MFETQLRPKAPWTSAKMTPQLMERMMHQIVPCRMQVTGIDGTWKLNQNKDDAVRLRAAARVEAAGQGAGTAVLASLMRQPPQ